MAARGSRLGSPTCARPSSAARASDCEAASPGSAPAPPPHSAPAGDAAGRDGRAVISVPTATSATNTTAAADSTRSVVTSAGVGVPRRRRGGGGGVDGGRAGRGAVLSGSGLRRAPRVGEIPLREQVNEHQRARDAGRGDQPEPPPRPSGTAPCRVHVNRGGARRCRRVADPGHGGDRDDAQRDGQQRDDEDERRRIAQGVRPVDRPVTARQRPAQGDRGQTDERKQHRGLRRRLGGRPHHLPHCSMRKARNRRYCDGSGGPATDGLPGPAGSARVAAANRCYAAPSPARSWSAGCPAAPVRPRRRSGTAAAVRPAGGSAAPDTGTG